MADPITLAGYFLGTTSSISIAGVALTTATGAYTAAGVAFSIGGSYLIQSAASSLLGGSTRKQQDITSELALPTSTPAYRFVYGITRATGTLIAAPIRGDYAYGVWLINSRDSEGDFSLFLDKREVASTGDPYDFSLSGGATATEFPFENHCKYWVGLGDQTSAPAEILSDAPWAAGVDDELFKATDIGKGCTVLWMRWKAGSNEERQERWPSTPPRVEIEGKFSKCYDPRDTLQTLEDKSTWVWTDNHTLVTLDTLTQNPFRPYKEANLLLGTFKSGADDADTFVGKKGGTVEKRYTTGGTLVFSGGEIEDIVNPILAAGAARLTRVAGKLGFISGKYHTPDYTLVDSLGDISYSTKKPSDNLPTVLRVSYTSADRGYETAELTPYSISGAKELDGGIDQVAELDLTWCQVATQAMRVRKIEALRLRRQKRLALVAPPDAISLISGANLTLSLSGVYSRLNSTYEVLSTSPSLDLLGQSGGVSLRNPLTLVENSEAIFAYDAEVEEEEVISPEYYSDRKGVRPPSNISAEVVEESTGGSIIQKFRVEFDPSPSTAITAYDWQYKTTDGSYVDQPDVNIDNLEGGRVYTFTQAIDPTKVYDIRVKALASIGGSSWVYLLGLTAQFILTSVTATGGIGEVVFTATTPSINFKGVRVYRNSIGASFSTATLQGVTTEYAGGVSISHTTDSQPVGSYDYWVVPVTITNSEGTPDGPHTITIL